MPQSHPWAMMLLSSSVISGRRQKLNTSFHRCQNCYYIICMVFSVENTFLFSNGRTTQCFKESYDMDNEKYHIFCYFSDMGVPATSGWPSEVARVITVLLSRASMRKESAKPADSSGHRQVLRNATFTFVGLLELSTFVGLLDLLLGRYRNDCLIRACEPLPMSQVLASCQRFRKMCWISTFKRSLNVLFFSGKY